MVAFSHHVMTISTNLRLNSDMGRKERENEEEHSERLLRQRVNRMQRKAKETAMFRIKRLEYERKKNEIYVNIPLNDAKKRQEDGKKQPKDPGFDQNHKP